VPEQGPGLVTTAYFPRLTMRIDVLVVCSFVVASSVLGQDTPAAPRRDMGGGKCSDNPYNCADAPNPVTAPNTVWLEEMTWMDVRDAMKAGKTTIIVPTGGVEPNGPWLALGKHNYVLTANCEAIARKLGDALCAPIIKLVPEGRIEPPSGHMMSPGTISVREATFRAMLTDVVHSLKMHGFKHIILIGDSGGNQGGQRAVADSLTVLWKGEPVVAHVQEYYDYAGAAKHMSTRGIVDGASDNLHDDPIISLNMFAADPASIRYDERVRAGKATINGVSIADRAKAAEWAREIVEFRTVTTVDAIKNAIANKGTLPAPTRR
jgi:creatinine amidohydrolase